MEEIIETEDNACFLNVELEALQSIYINETEVQKEEQLTIVSIDLHPATADKLDEQYVKMTLKLTLSEDYPEVIPEIDIRNPRGLSDEKLTSIIHDLVKIAESKKGNSMLFEIIEAAKDYLTAGNRPCGECAICLYGFHNDDVFTKTDCYHYFHSHCLARYSETSMLMREESECEEESKETELLCPVCRFPIQFKNSEKAFPPPVKGDEHFELTDTILELQKKMNDLYLKQVEKGGIIDLEAEKNKYLLEISHVPTITDTETKLENAESDSSVIEIEEDDSLTSHSLEQNDINSESLSPEDSKLKQDRKNPESDTEHKKYEKNVGGRGFRGLNNNRFRGYDNRRNNGRFDDYKRNDRYSGDNRNERYYDSDRRNNRYDNDRRYNRYVGDRRNNTYDSDKRNTRYGNDRRNNRYDNDRKDSQKYDGDRKNYRYDEDRRNEKQKNEKANEDKVERFQERPANEFSVKERNGPQDKKNTSLEDNEECNFEKNYNHHDKNNERLDRKQDRRDDRGYDNRTNRYDNRPNFRSNDRRDFRSNNRRFDYDEDRVSNRTPNRNFRDRGPRKNEQFRYEKNFIFNKEERNRNEIDTLENSKYEDKNQIRNECVDAKEASSLPHNSLKLEKNRNSELENTISIETSPQTENLLDGDDKVNKRPSNASDDAKSPYNSYNRNKFSNRNPNTHNRTGEQNNRNNPRYRSNKNFNAPKYNDYSRNKYSKSRSLENESENITLSHERDTTCVNASNLQEASDDGHLCNSRKLKNDESDVDEQGYELDRKNIRKINSFNNGKEQSRNSSRHNWEDNTKHGEDRRHFGSNRNYKDSNSSRSFLLEKNCQGDFSRTSRESFGKYSPKKERIDNSYRKSDKNNLENNTETKSDETVLHENVSKSEKLEKSSAPVASKAADVNNSVPTSNFLPPMSSALAPPPGFQNPSRKIVYGLAAANPPPGFNRS